MSGSNSGEDVKRRRVDDGGAALSAGQEREGDGFAGELLSMMNKLLDQNRSQTASMASMQEELTGVRGEMKEMKEEMKNLREKCDGMEKSVKGVDSGLVERDDIVARFDNVENSLNYHEVLLKNHKWDYSVSFPDVEDGSEEKQFLDAIKEETCNMRYGKYPVWRDRGSVYIYGCRLDYDAAFLPHWIEFVNALQEYQYALKCLPEESKTVFQLHAVHLPKRVLDLLLGALKSTHFKSICLQDNDFGRDGIKFALEYMKNNPILEGLHVVGNPIDHEEDINLLCELIEDHPNIDNIDLDRSCGEEINGHEVLCSILTAGKIKLKYIDLSFNDFSTGGSTFIADFLATNPVLERLVLEGNNFVDEDAQFIADALKHNTNLRFLDITGNNITDDSGWDALRTAEFDSTSLNSAADSNHTCQIFGASRFNGNPDDADDADDLLEPKSVRKMKIYSLLSSRNRECSNVQHLDNVPVEFLPDMLVSIQQYSEYHLGDKAPPKHNDDVIPFCGVRNNAEMG